MTQAFRPLPALATAALAMVAASPALAQDTRLADVLECRDAASLGLGLEAVMALAQADRFQCRRLGTQRGDSVTCTATGAATAFGARLREFVLADDGQGGRLLAVAFTEAPARLAPAIERSRQAAVPDSPLRAARIGEREDGVAELLCTLAGPGAGTGSIAGALDFRGMQPVPAMRVCAAPIRQVDRPQCVQTTAGSQRYRIDGLAAGDYYVTAYPLHDNPNRLIAAYARPLPGCVAATCPERLQAVPVGAGQLRDGIDPLTLLPGLPAALRAGATAGR
jgi:hypothetical protein